MENTRDTIIYQALNLFSDKGFEGVSMRDIAGSVGIKASSLYNHFKSKEDIFNSIIEEMTKRYEEMIISMQIPHGEFEAVVEQYMQVSYEMLNEIAKGMFLYFLKDDFASKFRRLLTMEQYRSTLAGNIFQNFYIEGAIEYQSILFANMMAKGAFIQCDPNIMAIHFYSPIFLLLNKYDRLPNKEEEALDALSKHVRQFSDIYNKRD